ncbi:hypothetical protein ZYGR_0E01190 [Zygosaccharomyces rouxii]|uniref:ZYRO0B02618p n=2 Tax=Zygosaccharomyces rouxii TaxID=4956 RepID=C5DQS5_ZYGRC|nr:uncharacterized protein ZYRO0B02618g [Zygosaccharomyces rouxii]KAH9200314.1 hypothetical protein LQ764DRAFT_114495 [Zygosaccharomyces rouxii]GAV47104.1 hypothetical protein ZYGR_0E01190 [Zygosaccharomyces rouxii]CAR26136.1 ZYRO0B02618p [Zygosaccharomyces rouxii]
MGPRMVSTGRGGSGNIQPAKSNLSPKLVPQGSQTPNILQPVYSTGRGGAGNMRRNVNPRVTRKAQDVEQELEKEDAILVSDEDYISPVQEEDPVSATLSGANSRSHSSGGSKIKLQKSKTRQESNRERPKAIVLGRGGAGNIISPTSSVKDRRKEKNPKDGHKGMWSSIKHFFS